MRLRRILPALAASALLAACAPTQSGPAAAGGDVQTGTVRAWLFDEASRAPQAAAVKDAITARQIRAAKPDLYGIAVGGKYTYAMLPFLWANGGDLAKQDGVKWTSTVNSDQAKAGVAQYATLLKDDICPPAQCANLTGTQSVTAFAGGKAG